jgi:peptidoglycan/xylan/chitin deacetylase (PgdA/CDA1 family)
MVTLKKGIGTSGLMKISLLVLLLVATLIGDVNTVRSVSEESSYGMNNVSNLLGWEAKPVMVNIQIDLEKDGDQFTVFNILNEIEKYDWHATVFVTGEFASLHPDIVRAIENREHQIAVHGWQSGENLALLSYEEQLDLIQRSFSAVRDAVSRPGEVVDFKPQGYQFNDDTIKALQNFGAVSINGIFTSDESFCKCEYAKSLGKITFPYPITTEFWAIPISTIEVGPKDIPLDDNYIDNASEYINVLLRHYKQHNETKDPLVITVHASITGKDAVRLHALSQFLDFVKKSNGKVAPLPSIRHHTAYITNFDATGPTSASVGEQITVRVAYTANLYCPKYRFRAYGRYPGQEWKLLRSACYFPYTGSHSFNMQFSIPKPPANENKYTIRIVGLASFGTCALTDPNWPTYDSYEVMDEIEITVHPRCIPVPNRTIGKSDDKIDLVFVPDTDYGTPQNIDTWLPTFLSHINDQITQRLGGQPPVSGNLNRFNFYYTRDQGDATPDNKGPQSTLPAGLVSDCPFADAIVVFHNEEFGDSSSVNQRPNIYSAEGPVGRSFIHESGHGLFGLADEYDGPTYYFQPNPQPNIWRTEAACRTDATNEGWNPDDCWQFTTRDGGWWKLGTTEYIMYDGIYFSNGWGRPAARRISWVLDQYRDPPQVAKAILLRLHISDSGITLLESAMVNDFPPNYIPGTYDFTARVYSFDGNLLEEYGFGDPRIILGEQGYTGPTWLASTDFPLILPYFYNGENINIYDSANVLLLSVDISQYATGIINGTVTDHNGQPVANAFIQVSGPSEDSTFIDANGSYELMGLQPGAYTVRVTPPADVNLMSTSTLTTVIAGEITTVNFTLQQAGSIAGRVTANGVPIPNVHLYLSGYEPPRYATDADGRYIIPGLEAGTYTINIDAPGYEGWYITVNGAYAGLGTSVSINVALGQTTVVNFEQFPSNPPNQPTNISPPNGAMNVSLTPTLQASAFSDPDAGDTHQASQWQICSDSACSNIIHDSGEDTTNLTSYPVPSGALTPNTTYWWHVRYKDNRGAWSSYSNITSFTTISVIRGTATAFDKRGQPIATVQVDSPVPKVVNRPKRGTRTDCQWQDSIRFCRTLPNEVRLNTTFSITQRVTNTGSWTIARVRIEDILPPNVKLVSGKLVKECRNLRRRATCSNTYRVKVTSASATADQTIALRVFAVEGLSARDGTIRFLAQGEGIKDIQIAVFDLSGRLIFNSDWVANNFLWNGQNMRGKPLANGVYLYVVRVRGFDGREYVSAVRKLVIVR